MHLPIFIEILTQKDAGDCAVCCLSMYLGVPYPTVLQRVGKRILKSGMNGREMAELAATMGVTMTTHRKFDLYKDSGILTVMQAAVKKPKDTHAVVLLQGSVIDPANGRLWPEVDVFMQVEKYRTGTLMTGTTGGSE